MKHDEYYAEESFTGHVANGGRVYTGPGLLVGMSLIMGCFVMSTATKRSPNLGFKWLQRRVGAQFGTCAYFITTNVLYTHDNHGWVMRDWDRIGKRMFGPMLLDIERRRRHNAQE